MKRLLALLLSAMIMLSGSIALATVTNSETGEVVSYDDGTLRVYDRVVFEVIQPTQPFRGIIINDSPTPLAALSTTLNDLLDKLNNGDVENVELAGIENLVGEQDAEKIKTLPLEDRVTALLYVMGMLDAGTEIPQTVVALGLDTKNVFDPETGEFTENIEVIDFTEESIAKASTESGFGYFSRNNDKIPFMRLAMDVVHAAKGEYRNINLDQRTMVENYNFSYEKHEGKTEKGWGLFSIVSGVKSFFDR